MARHKLGRDSSRVMLRERRLQRGLLSALGLVLAACQGEAPPSGGGGGSNGTAPSASSGTSTVGGVGGGSSAGSSPVVAGGSQGGSVNGGSSSGGVASAVGGGSASGAAGASTTGGAGSSASGAGGSSGSGGAAGGQAGSAGANGGGSGGTANVPMCKGTPTTLKDAGACSDRLIGTAIAANHLNDSSYTTTAKEFNYATPENEMKWDSIEPSQGNFNFAPGDQVVNFAKSNGMKVKGHTLVWRYSVPSWVSNIGSADALRSAMVNHITQVMNHYKAGGTVVAWDVVNEAWENDGTKFWDTPFSSKLGMGFVDDAFKAARAADANAKLYYNDYRADGMNAKANAIYNMVKGMVERGVPIDGVGLQVHTGTPNAPSTPDDILQNMQRIAALGLEIVISEMDVHVCDGLTAQQQKQYYHDVVAACVKVPKCTAITFWGASDKYSWVKDFNETNCAGKNPSACLWDDNWMKKSAYDGVMDALVGK